MKNTYPNCSTENLLQFHLLPSSPMIFVILDLNPRFRNIICLPRYFLYRERSNTLAFAKHKASLTKISSMRTRGPSRERDAQLTHLFANATSTTRTCRTNALGSQLFHFLYANAAKPSRTRWPLTSALREWGTTFANAKANSTASHPNPLRTRDIHRECEGQKPATPTIVFLQLFVAWNDPFNHPRPSGP